MAGQRYELEMLLETNNNLLYLQEAHQRYKCLEPQVRYDLKDILDTFRASVVRNLHDYREGVHFTLKVDRTKSGYMCKYVCLICDRQINVLPRVSQKLHKIGVHCSAIFKHIRQSTIHCQRERDFLQEEALAYTRSNQQQEQ